MAAAVRPVVLLLIGIILFAGLPVLGWGADDFRGFFSNPARLGYVVLVVLLQLFIVISFPEAGKRRTGEKTVRRQRLVVALMQILSIAIVVAAPYGDRRDSGVFDSSAQIIRYVGLVLFSGGLVLATWAEAKLGTLFSTDVTIQKGHVLVTDGLYRHLRHPRYLGIILFSAGIALIFRSWLALLLAGLTVLVLLWRIYDEEALMQQEFGPDWETYSKRSWRLIPYLY